MGVPRLTTLDLIKVNGIYRLPMEVYHAQCCEGPSISSSGLRTIFNVSPLHYWDKSLLNPERSEENDEEEKQYFVLGRAAHHLILGEEAFDTLFVARPERVLGMPWQGNRKECRQWTARQRNAGRTVLTRDQVEQIRGMSKALLAHPLVRNGILNGKIEHSLIWKDKETGVWLKARPDAIPNDSGDVADFKTTSRYGFDVDREVERYRYDMQTALTAIGFREVLNLEMTSFSFVFVSSKRPYCTDVLTLHKQDIERAEQDIRIAIRTFAHCLKTGDWFGPSGSQYDARWVGISDRTREFAALRRDFLNREINPTGVAA